MAWPLGLEFAGALYQVTARGNERRSFFLGNRDDDRAVFLDVLKSTCERFNWICHVYCLMSNHYLCEASHKTWLHITVERYNQGNAVPVCGLIFFMTRKPANFSCATPIYNTPSGPIPADAGEPLADNQMFYKRNPVLSLLC